MAEEFLFFFSDIRQCRRHIIRRMNLRGFHVISFLSRRKHCIGLLQRSGKHSIISLSARTKIRGGVCLEPYIGDIGIISLLVLVILYFQWNTLFRE